MKNTALSLFGLLMVTSLIAGAQAKPTKISIMAYNIENFFDGIQDTSPNREDYTYLSLDYKKSHPAVLAFCNAMKEGFYKQECLTLDWNQKVVADKVHRVVNAIMAATEGGPDVVIIEEIENINALKMLQAAMPMYKTAELIEGEDRRGIDIGILSKFAKAGESRINLLKYAQENQPNFKRPSTRGIMEVTLALPQGQKLTVLGFHFPSQSNPVQNRIDAINTLNSIMDRLGPDALVVAGGDSNVIKKEDDDLGLRTEMMKSRWKISHQVGCQDCRGTHYYKDEWAFLDILAFSNALTNGKGKYQLNPASIRVPKSGQFQTFPNGTPRRFDQDGVSDHLPIYGEIELK